MAYEPFHLGSRKHVFIDWGLIEPGYGLSFGGERPESWEMPQGLRLVGHLPRLAQVPLVTADRPWEARDALSGIGVYCTLFEDEGRYRLYYDGGDLSGKLDVDEDVGTQRILAYAESTDGVNWVKPSVGSVTYNGSRDNNLVYGGDASPGRDAHGATVFKDPSASPEERYKLVHIGSYEGRFCVFGAVSPDGLRWRPIERPLIPEYLSDTQCVVRFDPDKGRYVGYFRGWTAHEHGTVHARRIISYAETDRFETWPRPRPLVSADMHDGPDTDIYTNAYTPWPGADAHLMFPAFYHRNGDFTDVHLMTSRDGLHWQRPLRQPVIPAGEPGTSSMGGAYAGCGLVSLAEGEWSLPFSARRSSHNGVFFDNSLAETGVLTATWRQDGFVSLEAESVGACSTLLLDFAGRRLELNAWTRFGGEIRIELADASEDNRRTHTPPIAGRSFQDCDPISGDHLSRTVTWRGESDLSTWSGRPIRVRLQLRRARLYAMQFV